MPMTFQNGARPPEALQYAFGPSLPALSDEQCGLFAELVEMSGGMPFGWAGAQEEFKKRYEADIPKGRWVLRP